MSLFNSVFLISILNVVVETFGFNIWTPLYPTEKSGIQNLDFREEGGLAEYDQITVQDRHTNKQIN